MSTNPHLVAFCKTAGLMGQANKQWEAALLACARPDVADYRDHMAALRSTLAELRVSVAAAEKMLPTD